MPATTVIRTNNNVSLIGDESVVYFASEVESEVNAGASIGNPPQPLLDSRLAPLKDQERQRSRNRYRPAGQRQQAKSMLIDTFA